MNRNHVKMLGLLACLMAAPALAQQPTPAPVKPDAAPAQPAPAPDNPDAAAPPEIPTCQGPDGKMHTFPLKVYDETLDARKQIAEGLAKAKAENKRVLVMWGENWCQFCLFLEDIVLNDPGCKPLVRSDFVLVKIDLGKNFAKNRNVAEQYFVFQWTARPDGKMMGAPSLSVLDPDTGTTWGVWDPATGTHTGVMGGNDMVAKPMTLSRLFDETVIKEFLIRTRPPQKPAAETMNKAVAAAKRDSKPILAMFTMPMCDDCDKMGEWLSRPGVAAVLDNSFVTTRIDLERMLGAQEMLLKALGAGKFAVPPVLVVINDKGEPVNKDAVFTALPRTDEQIGAFIKGLSATARLGETDKALLAKSLKDAALVQATLPAPKP